MKLSYPNSIRIEDFSVNNKFTEEPILVFGEGEYLSVKKNVASLAIFTLLLLGMLSFAFNIKPAKGEWTGTVYIRADGSIDPPTAPIQRDGDIYTFTTNIYDRIVVQRSGITIDGARYILQGYQDGNGLDLSGVSNVTIRRINVQKFANGIYINGSLAIDILGNNIEGNYYGIIVQASSEIIIHENNIRANDPDGIFFQSNCLYNYIFRNNITQNDIGILLHGSSGNRIYENSITYNSNHGIHALWPMINPSPSNNNTFYENDIKNNGNGIYLSFSSDNSIYENNIIGSGQYGIWVEGINHTIFGNNVTNTGRVGICLWESSKSVVSGNNIARSGSQGLWLNNSPNNTIFQNDIASNAGGIVLHGSSNNIMCDNNVIGNAGDGVFIGGSNNKLYHNNIINNGRQAYSSDENNVWDDGYPSGGNFWSDYTGVDEKSGPSQDQPGSDGIGDTAYFIEIYNIDRYPLMKTVVFPLKKHVQIFTRPYVPIAELIVTYKWIDNINGEDFYVVFNVQICTRGFTGIFKSFIRDGSGHTIWSDSLLIWPGKPYIKNYSFEGNPLAVRGSDEIGISLKGIDLITALVKGVKRAADWLLDKLQPYLDVDDILKLVGVETWEEYPIAFAKSASTQFYPDSIENPELPTDMPSMQLTYLASPGELRVYDLEGRVTGLVNGEVREEIPNSAYLNDTVMILSPSGSYYHEVVGTEYGSYRLTIASIIEEGNVFAAVDIPISNDAVHQYAIDWGALLVGEDGVTVRVDSDGDGFFEKTFTSDNKLANEEFLFPKNAVFTFNAFWNGDSYPIVVFSSNSAITDFAFSDPVAGQIGHISFKVSGETQASGYCNVSIPRAFLKGPWKIMLNGTEWASTTAENDTHSFIYFNYTHTCTYEVTIQGTWVIPEFSLIIMLPLFILLTVLIAVFMKKKLAKLQSIHFSSNLS